MKSKILWWPFLQRHKMKLAAIILVGLLSSFCTLLLPLSVGKFIELTTGGGTGKTQALRMLGIHLPNNMLSFFSFFLIVLLVKFLSNWGYNLSVLLFGELFTAELRSSLLDYMLKIKNTRNSSGHKASRLIPFTNDAKTLQLMLTKGVISFLTDFLFILMALYLLFSLQPLLTSMIVVMTAFFYVVQRWLNQRNKPLFNKKRNQQASLLNITSEILFSENDMTAIQKKELELKKNKFKKTLFHFHVKKTFLRALSPLMLYLILATVMGIISAGGTPNELAPADIITFILLLMTIFPSLRNIIRIENTWVQGNLSAEKYIIALSKNKTAEQVEKTTNLNIQQPLAN